MDELIFQYLPIHLKVDQPYGILKRPVSTAVILLRDGQGHWVLGRKEQVYPEGIARMVGGGIDDNEHPAATAQREAEEELGVKLDIEKLIPLIHAEIIAQLPDKSQISTSVFVFYAQTFDPVHPASDIDGLVRYTDRELGDLVTRFSQLSQDPIKNNQHNYPTWFDYGQIWGPIHQAALARVKDLSL